MSNALSVMTNKTGPKPLPRLPCAAFGCSLQADHPKCGLCHKHYQRNRRRGTTTIPARDRGTGTITTNGYIAIAKDGKKKQEHVLIVEAVLGRQLPHGAEIHHVNEIRSDNRNCNLVVCPSKAYHHMLHQRQRSLEACGNPDFRKCPICKQYDDPKLMSHNVKSRHFYHARCRTNYNRKCRERNQT